MVVKFISPLPAVTEHDMGIPYVAGSVPSTNICGTSIDPLQGMLLPEQLIVDFSADARGAGRWPLPQPYRDRLTSNRKKQITKSRDGTIHPPDAASKCQKLPG